MWRDAVEAVRDWWVGLFGVRVGRMTWLFCSSACYLRSRRGCAPSVDTLTNVEDDEP